jgi:hypothetical protein
MWNFNAISVSITKKLQFCSKTCLDRIINIGLKELKRQIIEIRY